VSIEQASRTELHGMLWQDNLAHLFKRIRVGTRRADPSINVQFEFLSSKARHQSGDDPYPDTGSLWIDVFIFLEDGNIVGIGSRNQ
jgi:hypothetical protein